MHVGEAVILSTSQLPDGDQEVELEAVCPDSGCERLNVVVDRCRVAVPLDRPQQGALRQFKVRMHADKPLQLGDKLPVEFFFPGEQAGSR